MQYGERRVSYEDFCAIILLCGLITVNSLQCLSSPLNDETKHGTSMRYGSWLLYILFGSSIFVVATYAGETEAGTLWCYMGR
jgi:hypothetical protein